MRLQIEKQLNKQLIQTFRYHKGWLVPLFLAVPVVPIAVVKSFSTPSQPTPQPTNLQVNLGVSGSGQVTHAPANIKTQVKAQTKAQKQPQKHSTNSQAKAQQSHNSTHPPALTPSYEGQLDMLVEIGKGVNQLGISTSTPGTIADDSGRPLRAIQAMQAIQAESSDRSINLNSWQAPASIWVQASQGGYVFVGERWYRGRVRLILQNDGLLAVNQVGLEDYLTSVVGSEMYAHWPVEALKAQAVAARSYALARYVQPPSDYYHIGSDEAWQVYKGVETETGSTRAAVRATSGQILSYKGSIVDSLYAASDDLVITAHGGRGMSQQGAFALASQGYDYLHILGTYYPGTGLARLQLAKR